MRRLSPLSDWLRTHRLDLLALAGGVALALVYL